jgi:hypothetical protein
VEFKVKVNVRSWSFLHPEIREELNKRHADDENYSIEWEIDEALRRYYTLLKWEKLQLSESLNDNELLAIIAALNGYLFYSETIHLLPNVVADAIEYEAIDVHFNIDGKQLLEKLLNMSIASYFALVDAAEHFWRDREINGSFDITKIKDYLK